MSVSLHCTPAKGWVSRFLQGCCSLMSDAAFHSKHILHHYWCLSNKRRRQDYISIQNEVKNNFSNNKTVMSSRKDSTSTKVKLCMSPIISWSQIAQPSYTAPETAKPLVIWCYDPSSYLFPNARLCSTCGCPFFLIVPVPYVCNCVLWTLCL